MDNILSKRDLQDVYEYMERDMLYQYYSMLVDKENKLLQLLKAFGRLLLKNNEYYGEMNGVAYFVSLERNDYHRFIELALDRIADKSEIKKIEKITVNFFNLKSLVRCFSYYKNTKEIKLPFSSGIEDVIEPSKIERIIIFLNLIRNAGVYNSFSNLDFTNVSRIVVLGDVWQEESMLVQCANDKGIPTLTLQHALFIPSLDNTTYDCLNMWNVKAKGALFWGDFTKEQYQVNNPDLRCAVCGNPTIYKKTYEENNSLVGIAMDLPRMHEYNQKMISVVEEYAKKHSLKVKLRIHPADNKDSYIINKEISEFSSNLDTAFFIVAHTTTMLFTYIMSGKRVIKYKSDVPFFPIDDSIQFDTVDELEKCVALNSNDLSKTVEKEIQYIGDESKEKYKEYITKLTMEDI